MFQNWQFTFLQADSNDFIFQQGGAPPLWHLEFQAYLIKNVPQRWIGRRGTNDLAPCAPSARFPGITVCDFLLWEYDKDKV